MGSCGKQVLRSPAGVLTRAKAPAVADDRVPSSRAAEPMRCRNSLPIVFPAYISKLRIMTKPSFLHRKSLRSRLLLAMALAAFLFAQLASTVHASQLDGHEAGKPCEFCLLFSQSHAALPSTSSVHEGIDSAPAPTVEIIDVLVQHTSLSLPQVRAPPVQVL